MPGAQRRLRPIRPARSPTPTRPNATYGRWDRPSFRPGKKVILSTGRVRKVPSLSNGRMNNIMEMLLRAGTFLYELDQAQFARLPARATTNRDVIGIHASPVRTSASRSRPQG